MPSTPPPNPLSDFLVQLTEARGVLAYLHGIVVMTASRGPTPTQSDLKFDKLRSIVLELARALGLGMPTAEQVARWKAPLATNADIVHAHLDLEYLVTQMFLALSSRISHLGPEVVLTTTAVAQVLAHIESFEAWLASAPAGSSPLEQVKAHTAEVNERLREEANRSLPPPARTSRPSPVPTVPSEPTLLSTRPAIPPPPSHSDSGPPSKR